jgi:glucose-6-phosphate 1-epimerase
MHVTSEQLAAQYQQPGLHFETDQAGLIKVIVKTEASSGELYLQGAHVTQFVPAGHSPVLWMSEHSNYSVGKPIRGGVPICFPWFGPHASQSDAPAHGLARIVEWQIQHIEALATAGIAVTLTTQIEDFELSYRVAFAEDLQLNLRVTLAEHATRASSYDEALHSYFSIEDIHNVSIEGLEDAEYIDKVDNTLLKPLAGAPIRFDGECDRVYLNTTSTCKLHDHTANRCVIVSKSNSLNTVVWNPWIAKSARMPDFGDHEWQKMVCIESANIGGSAVKLEPGQSHELAVRISVQ